MEPYAINTIVEHARQVHLEVDCLRLILSGQHLWGILSWPNIHARREGTLEIEGTHEMQFFLLVGLISTMLDNGGKEATWVTRPRQLCAV